MPATRPNAFWLTLIFVCALASLPIVAQTLTTITVGSNPVFVAVNPVTNKVYVANNGSANVTVIDGATNDILATVAADNGPSEIAVNPATNKIYVTDGRANLVTVIDGATNHSIPVIVGSDPFAVVVNSSTNKIYVGNFSGGTVTVIDGATNATTTIAVGSNPVALAVNSITNKIYVVNQNSNNVTVIDGTTNSVLTTLGVGTHPSGIALDPVTNKIYVTNANSQNITIIDGVSNSTSFTPTGNTPVGVAVNPVRNLIYVANQTSNTVTVINGATGSAMDTVALPNSPSAIAVDAVTDQVYATFNDTSFGNSGVTIIDGGTDNPTSFPFHGNPGSLSVNPVTDRIYISNQTQNNVVVVSYNNTTAMRFVPLTPCRVVDTRHGNGGIMAANTFRSFAMLGTCGIPTSALAYSLNVTVVPPGPLGYLTIWPTGLDQPIVSTLNSPDGRVKANAAIVPAGYNGDVSVFVNDATHVILDINGYFVAATDSSALQFYPLTPCRVVDTRQSSTVGLGSPSLQAGVPRDFPILNSSCGIPSTAQAYSMNFTVVPPGPLGFITAWPSDQTQPVVSTLNDPTGTIVANAAIVPASAANGDISVYANNNTQLVIDIDGYFAPASSGLSFYPGQPCRALDTRRSHGLFSGELVVNVLGSVCEPPASAQAYVMNATVVPPGPMGYLTLWPDGETQPVVSTLNAFDGAITSNLAIVPTTNGKIDAFAFNPTQLLLDLAGYFAP